MVETKKLRTSSGEEEKEVDRISKLPDELIHHIMSFMDTQYAVQTSVLSKRWIDIWKSLQSLRFRTCSSESELRRKGWWEDFIDRVLHLGDYCSIQRFRVTSYSDDVSISSVNRWIDTVVHRNVQEVTIKLWEYSLDDNYSTTYEVPCRLLKCQSLKKLTLRKLSSPSVCLILPKSMSLPQLKFMCLDGFLLSDVESSKRLFSSCPVLETLDIRDCYLIKTDDQRILSMESINLKQFAYTNRTGFKPCIIKLSAPNLNNFTCESFWTVDYHLVNCTDQLSDVKFNILYYYQYKNKQLGEKQEYGRRMVKLLAAVDKVKRLELSCGFLEVMSIATDLVDCQHPCLCNLQSLRLEMWFTRENFRAIAYLLTISPNIKTLILEPNIITLKQFHEWYPSSSDSAPGLLEPKLADVGDDWEVGFSLPGMLSHLNVVRMENAEGCDDELKILSFVLKNVKALEEIALYPCSNVNSLDISRKQYEDKLRALPRASSRIKMRWGHYLPYIV